MKDAQQHLLSFGIRPSYQRLAIMQYMLDRKSHPTAEEIYEALCLQIPTLSKMTVYNTLNMLCEVGAIGKIDIDDRNRRFDAFTDFHGHFMCSVCNEITNIEIADGQPQLHTLPKGAMIDDMQLLVKGKCAGCCNNGY